MAETECDANEVLEARVTQALKPTGVIKLFLGGTAAASLPSNLHKLRGRVREVFFDNSPNLTAIGPGSLSPLGSTLTRLQFDNCALESLPAEMGFLPQLQFLSLKNNRLTSFLWETPGLANLVELDLSHNRIAAFSPQAAEVILARAQVAEGVLPKRAAAAASAGGGAAAVASAGGGPRIFIDLTGNSEHFIRPAERTPPSQLLAMVPPAAATTCAVCGSTSSFSIHIAVRFLAVGGSPAMDYATALMTRTTPYTKLVPVIVPSCSAECVLALQRWREWQSLQRLL